MTEDLTPLSLPTSEWAAWTAERCEEQLARARMFVDDLKAALKSGEQVGPAEVMAVWNDVNIALSNAFAAASLFANVHPDEAVRSRAERAEQDGHMLLTVISLDRELYDVLAAFDPAELDEDSRRVHRLAVRDFRRAGVDQDDSVRDRVR